MFFILARRVVRVGTGKTGAYEPRQTNQTSWHVSGPFTSRRLAERACAAALATHTCLSAELLTRAELAGLYARVRYSSADHSLACALSAILDAHPDA